MHAYNTCVILSQHSVRSVRMAGLCTFENKKITNCGAKVSGVMAGNAVIKAAVTGALWSESTFSIQFF